MWRLRPLHDCVVNEAIEKAFQPSDQLLRKSEYVGIMMELFNAEERFLSTVYVSWSCLLREAFIEGE